MWQSIKWVRFLIRSSGRASLKRWQLTWPKYWERFLSAKELSRGDSKPKAQRWERASYVLDTDKLAHRVRCGVWKEAAGWDRVGLRQPSFRSLGFFLREMESHWGVAGRRVAWPAVQWGGWIGRGAGAGGGETESQRCSMTRLHTTIEWQGWAGWDQQRGRRRVFPGTWRRAPSAVSSTPQPCFEDRSPGKWRKELSSSWLWNAQKFSKHTSKIDTSTFWGDEDGMKTFPINSFSLLREAGFGMEWTSSCILKCNESFCCFLKKYTCSLQKKNQELHKHKKATN